MSWMSYQFIAFLWNFCLYIFTFFCLFLNVWGWLTLFLRPERKDIILIDRIIQNGWGWWWMFVWGKGVLAVSANRGIPSREWHHLLRILCLVAKGLLFEGGPFLLAQFDARRCHIDHFRPSPSSLLKIGHSRIAVPSTICKICSLGISLTPTTFHHSDHLSYLALDSRLSVQQPLDCLFKYICTPRMSSLCSPYGNFWSWMNDCLLFAYIFYVVLIKGFSVRSEMGLLVRIFDNWSSFKYIKGMIWVSWAENGKKSLKIVQNAHSRLIALYYLLAAYNLIFWNSALAVKSFTLISSFCLVRFVAVLVYFGSSRIVNFCLLLVLSKRSFSGDLNEKIEGCGCGCKWEYVWFYSLFLSDKFSLESSYTNL